MSGELEEYSRWELTVVLGGLLALWSEDPGVALAWAFVLGVMGLIVWMGRAR